MMPRIPTSGPSSGYGLRALLDELEEQGASPAAVLRRAGLRSANSQLSHAQRLAVLKAASDTAADPMTALAAGRRQKIHHFGVYGFALATSQTFGDAFTFGRQHLELAGAVLRISFKLEDGAGILRSHNPRALGSLLPFAAEFWRSSMVTLLSEILQEPFPSLRMRFPYARPRHANRYREIFNCPIEFDCESMEWHFDPAVLDRPCPNANSLTSNICQDFCEAMIAKNSAASPLQREVRSYILANTGGRCTAEEAAAALGLSKRTLFRRLADEQTSFQSLLDQTRSALACEYRENTNLAVGDIGERCGYADEANFRKAFRKWQQLTPSQWRRRGPEH
jgi:AraC-like DNA-binding protein